MFNAKLYPFQEVGRDFAVQHNSCAIFDEMGTGKTIQSLAACEQLKDTAGIKQVLIVVRSSLKQQWESEIKKFTDSSAKVVEGSPSKRAKMWLEPTFYTIISYELLLHDKQPFLHPWDVIILDESTKIKNFASKVTKAAKQLRSGRKICLTGYPMENYPEELYNLFSFLAPGVLGNWWDFSSRYIVYRERVFGTKHWKEVEKYVNLQDLRARAKPFYIRRTIDEVLKDLPPIMETYREMEMLPDQYKMYHHINSKMKMGYKQLLAIQNKPWKTQSDEVECAKLQGMLFGGITMLRLASTSTQLVNESTSDARTMLLEGENYTNQSNKMEELVNIVSDLERSGSKSVVFTCYKGTLDIAAKRLISEGCGVETICGGMNTKKRQEALQNFKTNPAINTLISTDAFSFGTNLQFCSHLIILDTPWNPAILEQRNARLRRIGQENTVEVIYLISKDSFDTRMFELINQKKEYFQALIGKDEMVAEPKVSLTQVGWLIGSEEEEIA